MQIDVIRLEILHKLLIQKIETEWQQKWSRYGEFRGIENLPSLNAFLETLLEDIEKTIKPKLGLKATAEILISKDSLRRFIQQSQTNAKLKTRQTLAFYLGYEGWNDFLEKNEDTINEAILAITNIEDVENTGSIDEDTEDIETTDAANSATEVTTTSTVMEVEAPPSKKKEKKQIWLIVLGLVIAATAIYYFGTKEYTGIVFKLNPSLENNFPTVAKIEYDIGQLDIKNTYIKQHNEPLDWYLKNDTHIYQLDNSLGPHPKGERVLRCDKPGLYHLELISNDKTISNIGVPIRAKDWFGIAYTQEKKGNKEFVFTNSADWETLRLKQGKKQLSIPKNFLSGDLLDSRYRSDFYFSGDIDIDVDEMCLEVRFTSANEFESMDCKYFQMGFVDSQSEYSFIYSPISTCSTEGQIKVGRWHDSIPFPNTFKDILSVDTKKPDHSARFYFKDQKAYVELDGSLRYEKRYGIDMGKFEVFNLSLNGDSRIKYFKVFNTTTFRTVYEESFD